MPLVARQDGEREDRLSAVRLGCLEQVIRTAAHLIRGIPRTRHLSGYMLDVLHLLPFQQPVIFRIAALVWRCLLALAITYLRDLCCPTLGRGLSSLRSMEHGTCSLSLLPVLTHSTLV